MQKFGNRQIQEYKTERDREPYPVSSLEAAETLGIELPVEDYETIGGFLVHLLERIPTDGEQPSVAYEGYNFHVQDVRERRIYSVLAERTPDEEELKIEN